MKASWRVKLQFCKEILKLKKSLYLNITLSDLKLKEKVFVGDFDKIHVTKHNIWRHPFDGDLKSRLRKYLKESIFLENKQFIIETYKNFSKFCFCCSDNLWWSLEHQKNAARIDTLEWFSDFKFLWFFQSFRKT